MHKKKIVEFDDNDLLLYMKLPAKKKLEHLEQMNRFLQKIRPARYKKISQQLAREGF